MKSASKEFVTLVKQLCVYAVFLTVLFGLLTLATSCGNDDDDYYYSDPVVQLDKRHGSAYAVSVNDVRDIVVVCYKDVAFIKNSADSQDVHPITGTKLCEAK